MSKGLQWVIGLCLILVVAAMVFSAVAPFFLPRVAAPLAAGAPGLDQGAGRGFGFRGPGHMLGGRGMMGGLPFMRGGMFLGPVLVIGLIVLGAVWLTRKKSAPVTPPPGAPCPHCSQPLQAGWKACPQCGEKV